jgi:hypothetical protein
LSRPASNEEAAPPRGKIAGLAGASTWYGTAGRKKAAAAPTKSARRIAVIEDFILNISRLSSVFMSEKTEEMKKVWWCGGGGGVMMVSKKIDHHTREKIAARRNLRAVSTTGGPNNKLTFLKFGGFNFGAVCKRGVEISPTYHQSKPRAMKIKMTRRRATRASSSVRYEY